MLFILPFSSSILFLFLFDFCFTTHSFFFLLLFLDSRFDIEIIIFAFFRFLQQEKIMQWQTYIFLFFFLFVGCNLNLWIIFSLFSSHKHFLSNRYFVVVFVELKIHLFFTFLCIFFHIKIYSFITFLVPEEELSIDTLHMYLSTLRKSISNLFANFSSSPFDRRVQNCSKN